MRNLWRTLTRSRQLDRELNSEISTYVDLAVEDAIARGDDPSEARRRALAAVGGVASVEETVRSGRRGAWLTQALQDARYGLRVLGRAPAFATAVVLTLGLAIGATAAMMATVRAIVLAPLPYPASDRLVELVGQGYFGEYLQYRERSTTLDVAAYSQTGPATLTGQGEPVRLEVAIATSDFFAVLGVDPAHGTGWQPGDSAPGAEPIVMLSDRAWRQRFGARPDVVGSSVDIGGVSRRVRGIMPPRFAFPNAAVDVWTPTTIDASDRVATWSVGGSLVGRLRPGATFEEALAEVRTLAPTFGALFPWRMPADYGQNASVITLHERLVGEVDVMLSAALGAIGFVLVIACLNVGVLLLGRSMARRVEMATRAALGATRGRLMRQVLAECLMLAGLGGLAGLAVAVFAVSSAAALLPADLPRLEEVAPDRWLAAAVAALAALSGLMIAVVPVWRAARPGTTPASSVRHGSGDRVARATTRTLVTVEVALSVALVLGAGLLVRSLDRLLDVDPGFQPAGVLSATVAPSPQRYADAPVSRAFYQDALARLEALPQVSAAAVTDRLPFASPAWGSVFAIEDRPDPAQTGDWPWADYRSIVSPSFFSTLGLPITSGRAFAASDTATAEQVAIVSDALAQAYWPGESPLGRRFRFPGMAAGLWITIVGTVGDVKWERLSEETQGALFRPLAQSAPGAMTLVVRGVDDEPGALAGSLRSVVHGVDPDTAVDRMAPLADLVQRSARTSRFLAVLFSGFGIVGVLLGAIGIYGVTSDAVARRRHEIAIRLAIGAEARSIVRLVVRQSVVLAAVGVAVGLAGAFIGTRFLSSLLYGVAPTDPVTFVVVPAGLVAVVVLACVVPARRATRIDPLATLRES